MLKVTSCICCDETIIVPVEKIDPVCEFCYLNYTKEEIEYIKSHMEEV